MVFGKTFIRYSLRKILLRECLIKKIYAEKSNYWNDSILNWMLEVKKHDSEKEINSALKVTETIKER